MWPPRCVAFRKDTTDAGRTHVVSLSTSPGRLNVHTLFGLSDGSVWAAGSNYKFKTGLPSSATRQNNTHSCEVFASPVQVMPPISTSPVDVRVAAASLHSISATIAGADTGAAAGASASAASVAGAAALHLWGCGSDGRLGFPDFVEKRARYLYCERKPRQLAALKGHPVAVGAYWYETYVATADDA